MKTENPIRILLLTLILHLLPPRLVFHVVLLDHPPNFALLQVLVEARAQVFPPLLTDR